MIRMVLRPGARVSNSLDLYAAQQAELARLDKEIADLSAMPWSQQIAARLEYLEARKCVLEDLGRFTAALGLHGYRHSGEHRLRGDIDDVWVILNRTAVAVEGPARQLKFERRRGVNPHQTQADATDAEIRDGVVSDALRDYLAGGPQISSTAREPADNPDAYHTVVGRRAPLDDPPNTPPTTQAAEAAPTAKKTTQAAEPVNLDTDRGDPQPALIDSEIAPTTDSLRAPEQFDQGWSPEETDPVLPPEWAEGWVAVGGARQRAEAVLRGLVADANRRGASIDWDRLVIDIILARGSLVAPRGYTGVGSEGADLLLGEIQAAGQRYYWTWLLHRRVEEYRLVAQDPAADTHPRFIRLTAVARDAAEWAIADANAPDGAKARQLRDQFERDEVELASLDPWRPLPPGNVDGLDGLGEGLIWPSFNPWDRAPGINDVDPADNDSDPAMWGRRDRSERQSDDAPNRGFRIESLEGGHSSEPQPFEVMFPHGVDHKAKDFVRQYLDGSTPIEVVPSAYAEQRNGKTGFVVVFPVAASKFDEAVAAEHVPADIFATGDTINHTHIGADILDSLVEPDVKRAAIEASYRAQAHHVDHFYVNDLEELTHNDGRDGGGDVEVVSEAYDFSDGISTIRLLNFSSNRLGIERIRQTANVIRYMTERSGGELTGLLDTIMIVPEESALMQRQTTLPNGTTAMIPRNGFRGWRTLVLSDRILKPNDQRIPAPPQSAEFFDKFLEPGEPASGPHRPRNKVSVEEWEVTLAHETTHLLLPENTPGQRLPGPAPTLLGRENKGEHLAELGAAEFVGGEHALSIPDDQYRVLHEMWGLRTKKAPVLGPYFIVCRQLDLTNGPLPRRPRIPNRPLIVEITYRLVDDRQSESIPVESDHSMRDQDRPIF
ncbi:hypothetical protein ACIHDR_49050 [Nocardia sp. NPDC052278]|uniref:hypothetical protein n=1 Tax=unclassified Nocardia TaxID=2637762 RepID=UPI0036C76804